MVDQLVLVQYKAIKLCESLFMDLICDIYGFGDTLDGKLWPNSF